MRRIWPSSARRARGGVALVACLTFSTLAHAEPQGAGAASLARARSAWEKGDFDVAEPIFKQALDEGGLSPDETLDAYAHLGAARAVTGKTIPALDAFRHAAAIDPKFKVPSEAGKQAIALAEKAKKEKARAGSIQLAAETPHMAKAGTPFTVTATLDAAHVSSVSKIGIRATDPVSKKTHVQSAPAADKVKLEVPASVTMPGASIVVRVDALDTHDNRLASVEQRVQIEQPEKARAPIADARPQEKPKTTETTDKKKSGGFWSTAWPWLIGGVAITAGGAAAWWFGVHNVDEVSVGAARVTLVR